jgi:hypothetical protein
MEATMDFIILEINHVWEDRDSVGHDLQDRGMSFSEEVRLRDVWEWIKSDGIGEPRGNIKMIPEGK